MERCPDFMKTCLLACVASQVFAQSDAQRGQGPTANLPGPSIAEFRFLDRNGRTNNAPVEMRREGRYLVEGATLSTGQWRLQGLDADQYAENVVVQIDATIARQPFQEFKSDYLAAITLASPRSPLRSTQILFTGTP